MARRKTIITRTMKSTTATCLCLNVETAEPFNQAFQLSGTFKSDAELLSVLQETYNTEAQKIVHVVDVDVNTKRYGMTEDEFLAHAAILPDRKVPAEKAE